MSRCTRAYRKSRSSASLRDRARATGATLMRESILLASLIAAPSWQLWALPFLLICPHILCSSVVCPPPHQHVRLRPVSSSRRRLFPTTKATGKVAEGQASRSSGGCKPQGCPPTCTSSMKMNADTRDMPHLPLGPRHLCLAFFDVLHLNGESLIDQPYHVRRGVLESVIRPIQGFVSLQLLRADVSPWWRRAWRYRCTLV